MKTNNKVMNIIVYLIVLWTFVLLLNWIVTTIISLSFKKNIYDEFNQDLNPLVEVINDDYDTFVNNISNLDSNWIIINATITNPNTASNIIITNLSNVTGISVSDNYQVIVLRSNNNSTVAYQKLSDYLDNNIPYVFNHQVMLVDYYEGLLYIDSENEFDNYNFYYYFTERDLVTFKDYINDFLKGSMTINFNRNSYVIHFSQSQQGLLLVELVPLNNFILINNTLMLSFIIIFGVIGSLIITIKTILRKQQIEEALNKLELSSNMKYNDNNLIIWITAKGRIIDFNEQARKKLKTISKSITIYQLFSEADNTFEVYIKNQISFNVDLDNTAYEFRSLVQPHGYLLLGREGNEKSIEESKYRKAVFTNRITNLPNHLTLFEQANYFDLNKKPVLVAFGILDFEHITTVLGKNYTNELLNEVSNYLYSKVSGLPLKLFNAENDQFIVICETTIDFDYMGWVRRIISEATQITHKETNTKIQLNGAILEIDHRNLKDGIEILYYTLIETLDRVKESPIYDILVYSETLGINLRQDAIIEKDIKNAISKDEFVIFLQPILNMKTNEVVSFEALLRWNNPTYKNMSPQKYLKIIETNYLMKDVSNIIVTKVIQTASLLKPFGVNITVNISANEIIHDGFISKLVNLCKQFDVDPSSIGIEITENVLIHSEELIRQKVKSLRKYGFKIYIDDFGTGYSSLNYLRYLEVDAIKIDRTFINDINNNGKSFEIYETIVKLVKRLGLNVISEGVETLEQKDLLNKMGVELIQGFLVSLAVPVSEALAKLKAKKGK